MNERQQWQLLYRLLALGMSLLCAWGLIALSLGRIQPLRYHSSFAEMAAGFVAVSLLVWLPELLGWLKKKHPQGSSFQESFERAQREFSQLLDERDRH